MGENIRIVSDDVIEDVQKKCLNYFKWAKRIIFLGFQFDLQNLKNIGILDENKELFNRKEVYGSTYGLTPREIQQIEAYLKLNTVDCRLGLDGKGQLTAVNFLRKHIIL